MGNVRKQKNKHLEITIRDILKSRAQSYIYLYLLRKNGVRTEDIIKGTHLHPSTVRETLSEMYTLGLIYRKKIKNDRIGKKPYMYYPISPEKLIKKYVNEIEYRLNKLASLVIPSNEEENVRSVRITIYDEKADKK